MAREEGVGREREKRLWKDPWSWDGDGLLLPLLMTHRMLSNILDLTYS